MFVGAAVSEIRKSNRNRKEKNLQNGYFQFNTLSTHKMLANKVHPYIRTQEWVEESSPTRAMQRLCLVMSLLIISYIATYGMCFQSSKHWRYYIGNWKLWNSPKAVWLFALPNYEDRALISTIHICCY